MTLQSVSIIRTLVLLFFIISLVSHDASGQKEKLAKTSAGFPVNYDEALVGAYTLPDVLTVDNGEKVRDVKTWEEQRRPELLKLFDTIQFGTMPPKPHDVSFHIFDAGTPAFGGEAVHKQVTVCFTKDTSAYTMVLLLYLPVHASKPVPLFFMISFSANVLTVDDPGVRAGDIWTRDGKRVPASEGRAFAKLDVMKFIAQGIGVATVYYGDIEPDFKKGIEFGIRGHYLKPGTTRPAPDEWGAISAWSWGLSRAMDYIETDKEIDAKRVALFGVSRLGKTVLWTDARDTRFKMIIASCSGEGGAAISRRDYGENLKHLTDTSRYFYQFAAKYHSYAGRVNELPMDAHMLVALIAPRPILLQTGDSDYWSDPKGEFLSAVAAEPVYHLYGLKGPGTDIMPKAEDTGMLNTLGYYMHSGGHGTVPSDWDVYMTFIKKYL